MSNEPGEWTKEQQQQITEEILGDVGGLSSPYFENESWCVDEQLYPESRGYLQHRFESRRQAYEFVANAGRPDDDQGKGYNDVIDDWEYLLGEISARGVILNDGVLDRLNGSIRKSPVTEVTPEPNPKDKAHRALLQLYARANAFATIGHVSKETQKVAHAENKQYMTIVRNALTERA